MQIKIKITNIIIIASLLCQFMNYAFSQSNYDIEDVKKFSAPIIEDILEGIKAGDYRRYSKNFTDHLKNVITENKFKDISKNIKSEFGDYVSKKFWKFQDNISFITVFYKVKFSKADKDITLKIDLEKIQEETQIKPGEIETKEYIFVWEVSFIP